MVRRIACQVHKQVSRLTRAGFIKTPPVWYEAVLDHPPLPLPPREPPSRTSYDSSSSPSSNHAFASAATATKKTQGSRPLPITYVEDGIRRQFFRDHPFEAFRPRTLTEAGTVENEHPVSGLKWTRLNQRGRNPSPEEYVKPIILCQLLYQFLTQLAHLHHPFTHLLTHMQNTQFLFLFL
jgi:small subunit ribosomal protein S23